MTQQAGVTENQETEVKVSDDPERSYVLSPRAYWDPEVFSSEREEIFFRSWQYAGHTEDVPEIGSYITSNVLDQDLFVIRGHDNRLRAFYNVCQHRGHQLVSGQGRARRVITCPYHAWKYELDGRLHAARGQDRVPGFDPSRICLQEVQLEEFCNFLFVNLDPEARPIAELAGGLEAEIRSEVPSLDKLTRVARAEWTLEANWKVIVDNFLECYHCQVAHPAFARLVDLSTYRSKVHDIHSVHTSQSGTGDNPAYCFESDAECQVSAFWWIWPTMTFNVVPGPANIAVFHLKPLGPETTIEIVEYFFADTDLNETQQGRIDYANNVLQEEDNRLCESVQRGLKSRGYRRGRLMVNPERDELSEHAVHHFHWLITQVLPELR